MVDRSRHASVEMRLHWQSSDALHIELHPFERMGLVLAYFRQAGGFTGLGTASAHYFPRPADDPHAHERIYSDPVFAVWGERESVA